MGYTSIVLLCAFVSSAVAVPLDYRSEQCARHCTESDDFRYKPGTYTYDYETTTVTTIQGLTHEKSQLHMTSQVDIIVLTQCEFALKLRDVVLRQSDPQDPNNIIPIRSSREFSRVLEKNTLRFSYQDGKVDTLCPTDGEPSWVLNIKRGVLSVFQTSMMNLEGVERVNEIDVAGICTAEYTSLGQNWRGLMSIRKTKDLTMCTDRQNSNTVLQATPYTDDSTIQSLPLVKGNQECEQTIGSNILQSSICTETHIFRPFSRQTNGAITTVSQRLVFKSMNNRAFTGNDYRPTRENLLFDHDYEEMTTDQKEQEAEHALAEVCSAAKEIIRSSVPNKFAALVYKLRKLDHANLRSLFRRVDQICPDNPRGRKFLMDAIPIISTSASVRFMAEMINRQEMKGNEISFWFTSLAFVSNPTSEMVSILTPYLDGRHEQAILGISSLIHTYCKNKEDCGFSAEVKEAVKKLVSNLGESCYGPDEKKVLLSLKAIGNIGQIFGKESVLERCYMNPQNSMEVTLAAIQAFRRFSCDISRDALMNVYTNYNENTEKRIAAYLEIMKCPNANIISVVKNTLEKERVNQVGSFVWTHLTNLQKTTNPMNYFVKDIMSNLYLMNKYNTDIRKFSRALEGSIFFDSISTGVHLDSNIIFSPESYLVRSAMMNITFDLFGHTCNLFEIGGRMEGLEQVVETFFGPKGYFPKNAISKVLKNLREKRSIADNKIDKMDTEFDAKSRFYRDPKGSMYLKVFGNELLHTQFNGNNEGMNIDLMDVVTKLAKQQEIEYSKTFMFLDTTYTIPMATGMPLRLAVNGTASVGLKMGGKFNVRSFNEVDIRGLMKPSGAVEISTLMHVDAGITKTGLRMVATMHTSSAMDGFIEVKNGEIVKAQLNVPEERIEIIDIQSKVFLVHGNDENEQKTSSLERTDITRCTGKTISKIFGMELCGELEIPAGNRDTPMFPMSGSAGIHVFLRKTDPTMTSYNFEARWNKEMASRDGYIRRGVISINTPRSAIDREITAEYVLNQVEKSVMLKLKTPIKRLGVNAKYINEIKQKRFDLSMTMDDKEKFAVQSELRVENVEGGEKYTPIIEIRGPYRRLLGISGSAYLRYGQKYSGQLTVEDLTVKPIVLRGDIDIKEKDRYEGQISLNSYFIDTTVQGFTQSGESVSSKLTVDYQILQGRREKIDISGKFRDLSANVLTKYTGVLNFQATPIPQYTSVISWEMQSTTGHMENTLQINMGDNRRSRVHKITLQEIIRYEGSLSNNKAAATFKIVYPQRDIDYMLDLKHENTETSCKNRMGLQYAPGKQINTIIDMDLDTNKNFRFKSNMLLEYPGNEMKLTTDINEFRSREFQSIFTGQWKRGQQMRAIINYANKSDRSKFNHVFDAELTMPRKRPITFNGAMDLTRGKYIVNGGMVLNGEKYNFDVGYTALPQKHSFNGKLEMLQNIHSLDASVQSNRGEISGDLDIKEAITNRHITAKFNTKNTKPKDTIAFEILWDADRDRSRRISMEGELRCPPSGHEGKLILSVPDKTIQGSFSTNMEGSLLNGVFKGNNKAEIEWTPGQKMTLGLSVDANLTPTRRQFIGDVLLTTTFRGYEDMSFRLMHNDNQREWNSIITTQWQPNQKVAFSTEGKYYTDRYGKNIIAYVKLESPIRGLESIVFDLTHASGSSEFSDKVELLWVNKKISAGLHGSLTGNGVRGGMNITTPFSILRDVSASFVHSRAPGMYKTVADFQWEPSKKITFEVEGKHPSNARRTICQFSMKCTTPFRGFDTMSTTINYNNDGRMLNINTETNCGYNKVVFGLTGSKRNAFDFDGKINFNSPFRHYENLQATASFQCTDETLKTLMDLQLPYSKIISMKSEGKMNTINDIEFSSVITSTFADFESMSLNFIHKLTSNLRTSVEMTYGNKKITALLTGIHNSGWKTRNLEANLVINTPFRKYDQIKFSLNHDQRDLQFTTRFQTSRNTDVILAVHTLNIKDILNFESNLHITTPFSNLRVIQSTINQENYPGTFKHNNNFEWGRNNKISFSANYANKPDNVMSLKLFTPFTCLKKFTINSALITKMDSEYKPSIAIEWNNDKIELEGHLINNEFSRMTSKLAFTSTIYGYESLILLGKYDIQAPTKTAELIFKKEQTSPLTMSVSCSMIQTDDKGQLEITVMTPIKDFEKVIVGGNFDLQEDEKSATVFYQWGWKKMAVSGKLENNDQSTFVQLTVNTPFKDYEDLTTSARFTNGGYQTTAELSCQWAPNKKFIMLAEYLQRTTGLTVKGTIKSPFKGYEVLLMQVKTDKKDSKQTFGGFYQWDVFKKIEFNTEIDIVNNGCGLTASFRSPFKNFEELTLDGSFKNERGNLQMDGNLQWQPKKKISVSGSLQHNRFSPSEVKFSIDTPFSPLRNVKFVLNVNSKPDHFELTSGLEWERNKKMDLVVSLKNPEFGSVEGKIKLNTPFRNYRELGVDAMTSYHYKSVTGRLNIVTPIKGAERFDLEGQFDTTNDGYGIDLTAKTPFRQFSVTGNIKNMQFQPFEAKMLIKTPYDNYESISFATTINVNSMTSTDIEIDFETPKMSNNFKTVLKIGDQNVNINTNIRSPLLEYSTFNSGLELDWSDDNTPWATFTVKYPQVHRILISFQRSPMEFKTEMESPLLSEKMMTIKIKFMNNRYRNMAGGIIVTTPSMVHEMNAKYTTNSRQTNIQIGIKCPWMTSRVMNIDMSLINSNNRDMEASVNIKTPRTTHSIVCSVKNYEIEKQAQIKIESPLLDFRTVSVTATMKNDNFKAMEGTFTVSIPDKEVRIAGNMKREGWNNIEAFATINTPVEALRMIRIDTKFTNDRYQNVDGNLQIETSHESFPLMALSGKLRRSQGMEDLSINLRLPTEEYKNIGLLANMHYERDWSSITPRVTLSLPQKRYSAYATYGTKGGEIATSIGYEWQNKKVELSTTLKIESMNNIDCLMIIVTPFRGHENYEGRVTFSNRKRDNLVITYKNPEQKVSTFRARMNYQSPLNFNGKIGLAMPDMSEMSVGMKQEYFKGFWMSNLEVTNANKKQVMITFQHRANNTHYIGSFDLNGQFMTRGPFNIAYTVLNNRWNTEGNFQISKADTILFRSEIKSILSQEVGKPMRTIMMEFPRKQFVITLSSKPLPAGNEIFARTVTKTRTTSFLSIYQNTRDVLNHEMKINWDERLGRELSYKIRFADTSRGSSMSSEFFGRLNLPIRSFELKGTHSSNPRVTSCGMDFFWDAARDNNKHMAIGFEHHDISTGAKNEYKLKITASHPKLSKDLVATTHVSCSDTELFGKTEIEYSKNVQHNILLEARARDMSRGHTHYIVFLTGRHPVSNMDIRFSGEVLNTDQEASAHIRLNHMDYKRQQKVQEIKAKLLKTNKETNLLLRSNNYEMTLAGRMINKDKEFAVFVDHKINDQTPVLSWIKIAKTPQKMELNISSPVTPGIHVIGSLMDTSSLLKVSHLTGDKMDMITDANLYLGLDKTILKSKLTYRKEMWNEIKDFLTGRYSDMKSSVLTTTNQIYEDTTNEISNKVNIMNRAMTQELSPFKEEMVREMGRFFMDVKRASNDLYTMYQNNEFYVKDVAEGMAAFFEYLSTIITDMINHMMFMAEKLNTMIMNMYEYCKENMWRTCEYMVDMYYRCMREMCHIMDKLEVAIFKMMHSTWMFVFDTMLDICDFVGEKASELYEYIQINGLQFIRTYCPFLETYYQCSKNKMAEIYDAAVEMMESIYDNPFVQAMSDYWSRIMATITAFQEQNIMETLSNKYSDVIDYMQYAAQSAIQYYDDFSNNPQVQYVGSVINTAMEKSIQIRNYLGIDQWIKSVFQSTIQRTASMVWNEAQDMMKEISKMRFMPTFEIMPGSVSVECPLTLPSLFFAVDDFESFDHIEKMRMPIYNLIFTESHHLWSIYYRAKKYFTWSYWIPPFDTYAVMSGNQHFMTFDKFHFDFAGECNYLLARDFVDGNFTVSVNYVNDGRKIVKKSITVLSDGKKIEVSPDYKVTIDDTKVELPLKIGETTIKREGVIVHIHSERGFDILFNFIHDVCTLKMSGFYFGKTGGLFGTYDNEPMLDMMTPERRMADSVESFANSWEVGTAMCRKGPNMASLVTNDYKINSKCKEIFGKNSEIFKHCFSMVNPEPFERMCVSDLTLENENNFNTAICTSAAAYVAECKEAGVPMMMPKSCLTCEKHDGSKMEAGDMIKFTKDEPVYAADVVFVVEEKECNRDVAKMLGKLAVGIEESYRQKNYRNIRYAVVAFGGDNVHSDAHIHTIDGQLFGSIRAVDSAFASLSIGNGPSNIMKALKYAANLPFRAGVTKTFILAKCSACNSEESRSEYGETLRILLDSDITLHMLHDQSYEMKTASKKYKASRVIGFDSKYAYTLKDVKDSVLKGDRDLLAQLRIPKDICIPLSLEVNGSTFASQMLMETKKNSFKKFIDIMTRRMAQTTEPSDCQMCECISNEDGVGKSICQRCVSRIIADMVSPDMSPIYFENTISDQKSDLEEETMDDMEDEEEFGAELDEYLQRSKVKKQKNKRKGRA